MFLEPYWLSAVLSCKQGGCDLIIISLLMVFLFLTYALLAIRRMPSLVFLFTVQSFVLFLITAVKAFQEGVSELAVIAILLFLVKVILIPILLRRVVRKIGAEGNLGLFLNPLLSLIFVLGMSWLIVKFTGRMGLTQTGDPGLAIAIIVTFTGLFLMVFRAKALAQIVGLLVMENGLFLAAATVAGGLPFFVEIAVFFDVFVCASILGTFVFRINRLFTHIDVDKLTQLKG